MVEIDNQQICLNGHQMTDSYEHHHELRHDFCPKCGEPTITVCQDCKASIPGHIYRDFIINPYREAVPSFCTSCGKPYPWTKKRIENFHELTNELDELTPEERNQLNRSLDELIQDSPKSDVASIRFKKIVLKLSRDSYDLVKNVATDLLSEALKKAIFGP